MTRVVKLKNVITIKQGGSNELPKRNREEANFHSTFYKDGLLPPSFDGHVRSLSSEKE